MLYWTWWSHLILLIHWQKIPSSVVKTFSVPLTCLLIILNILNLDVTFHTVSPRRLYQLFLSAISPTLFWSPWPTGFKGARVEYTPDTTWSITNSASTSMLMISPKIFLSDPQSVKKIILVSWITIGSFPLLIRGEIRLPRLILALLMVISSYLIIH